MSTAKHITQGGQVFSYMLNMFLQVNKRISFWLVNTYLALVPLIFWLRVPWQEIRNGGLYWWLYLSAAGESVLYQIPPVYDVPWDGQVLHYTSKAILGDPYMIYAGKLVRQEIFIAIFVASIIVLAVGWGVFSYLRRLGERQAEDEQVAGRELTDDVKAVARMMKTRGEASPLHVDGLPLMRDSELKNILLHGTPGTGKSNVLNKLLKQLRASGDMVIVYDKGCSLVKRHFNENIDKMLCPLDKRCENWDMWRECESTPDYDSMGNTLIPQGTSEDPFWTGAARTIFTAVAKEMKTDPERSYNKLLRTLLAINLKELREVVAGTEATNLMEEKVEKTAISIRGVLTNYVKALRYLQGIERSGKPPFAIREWMKRVNDPAVENGWLWITSHSRQHESLKPLISMWLAQAANCVLEMGENPTRRIWFIYDEIYTLHKLPELPHVMSEGRKFGSCFILGYQNKWQMDVVYGPDLATSMMDLLNTRYFFRSPDEQVANFTMRQLGQRRVKVFNEQYSYGVDTVRDGVSYSKQQEDQYLVNYSDVQSLPDLQCFVTLPGKYPVVHMSMRYEKMKFIAAEFLPRALNDSLAPDIDAEIERRESEFAGIDVSSLLSGLGRQAETPDKPVMPGGRTEAVKSANADVPPPVAAAGCVAAPAVSAPSVNEGSPVTAQSVSGSEVPPDASATSVTSDNAAASGGRVVERDGLLIDTSTGEVVEPETLQHEYEQYQRESMLAMREEEKNILHRQRADDGIEPGDNW
ncbi:type IV conjugative transfer system coupling protein TraD [Klebsiella aerogenes]|uniref:type IV conjugative transfer system coupling protein TraD n=1 Tax=Klebsiella aerogenes TaxID=548 RepID=UPI000DA1233D|nr:type IV conjugative transfer system coupling protein TraD [Klebsiella aerogenes]HCB2859826.1 type IV conjugative transfer system coupling protein TraD [Klebsiella aerogenes]HCB2864829.1 type IV conjugative transfer system coupling protein TraD [Klebsiella aerogenes]HCB2880499.1 type IV conjugative transfer system coupling protein TraD [Klebsiella aerogenes]HCB3345892.1 type IV conjugative transfer system coupling protein TraD [Klebsiella aerogenes]HCM1811894.1 type IV conjugative transfer s